MPQRQLAAPPPCASGVETRIIPPVNLLRHRSDLCRSVSALWLLAMLTGSCGQSAPAGPLNVLLISIDSLRQDRLGCYGHRPEYAPELAISPNIDALAERGTVFDSAWSSSSWTLPAHMSLLTGLGAAAHGVEAEHERLDPLRETLAERFQAAGWATGGVYSGPYLDPRHGFARGFDRYESAMLAPREVEALIARERARRAAAGQSPLSEAEERVFQGRVAHWDVTSPRVTALAESFLKERGAKPFFLFLHFFDVHYDHTPDAASPGLARRFDPDYVGDFDGSNWYFDARVRELAPPFTRHIGERDLHHVEALYDAEIQWVDHHVGRVLALLNQLGLAERTIVALVSDHGDEFFEHGGIGHHNTLFEEVTHIPLLLALPPGTRAARRVPEPVRIHDLAPTLLEFAGAPPLRESEGRSLRPLLAGSRDLPRPVFSRLYDPAPWFLNLRESWRDGRFTVVRHFLPQADTFEQTQDAETGQRIFHVYDRAEDPRELSALRPDDPRYARALSLQSAAWTDEHSFLDGLAHSPASECLALEADATQSASLAALGYASSEAERAAPRALLVLPPPWD